MPLTLNAGQSVTEAVLGVDSPVWPLMPSMEGLSSENLGLNIRGAKRSGSWAA